MGLLHIPNSQEANWKWWNKKVGKTNVADAKASQNKTYTLAREHVT
jgi:hypothetical protein